MIDLQTMLTASAGGALIGLAAVAMLLLNGRVMGVSGQLAGIFSTSVSDRTLRIAFIVGIVAGAALMSTIMPGVLGTTSHRSLPLLVVGGVIVGLGTRLGGGCTSGHGVCGLARNSARSLTATITFMVVAIGTVAVTRLITGAVFA